MSWLAHYNRCRPDSSLGPGLPEQIVNLTVDRSSSTLPCRFSTLTCRARDPKNVTHHALTFATYRELEDGVRSTAARCLIITGADPAFCSGDDVKVVMASASGKAATAKLEPRLTPAADAILNSDVPIIAAVNGAAVGWGMELALMADLRVASEKARFGELFIKRGRR